MTRLMQIIGTATVAALLGGCSGVIVSDSPGPRANYFDGDFEYAVHKGAVVAEVAGNPFGLSQAQFDSAVRGAMRNNVSTGDADFVASASETTVVPYKVVAAFNPRPGVSGGDLCRQGARTPTTPLGNSLSVKMVFCYGDSPKSAATAWINGVRDINDSRFRDLVRQTTLAMIPFQDGEDQGEANIP